MEQVFIRLAQFSVQVVEFLQLPLPDRFGQGHGFSVRRLAMYASASSI